MSSQPESTKPRQLKSSHALALLAVFAISSILAAILYPLLRVTRDEARNISKWSDHDENATIIGFALDMYCDDNDSRLPLAANWATALQPSVDELLEYWYQNEVKRVKQLQLDGDDAAPAKKSHFDIVRWSRDPFAMNRALSGVNVKNIKHPEQTVVFFETTERKPNLSGDQSIQLPPYGISKWSVYVMADGKVKVTEHAKAGSGRLVDRQGRPVTIRWEP